MSDRTPNEPDGSLPARVLSHARDVTVRFAASVADTSFHTAWANLRTLTAIRAG